LANKHGNGKAMEESMAMEESSALEITVLCRLFSTIL
jgi:hypothetical protein